MEETKKSSPEIQPANNQTPKFDLADDVATGQLLLEVDLKEQEKAKLEAETLRAPTPETTPKVEVKEQSAEKEPEWIPTKLKGKSKEEIVKIYLDAERAKTKAEQKLKEKEKTEIKKPEEPKIDSDKFYQELIDKPLEALSPVIAAEVKKALDSGIISTKVKEVIASQQEAVKKVNEHIAELQAKHPDFEKLRPKIHEVMKQLPESLWDEGSDADPMELAYKIAKSDFIEQASKEADKQSQEEESVKTKVFAESSGASSGVSKSKMSPDDDIRNSIVNSGRNIPLMPD